MATGLASLFAAVAALHYANACSTFMVNPDVAPDSAASARTMDFSYIDLSTTLNIVPKGSMLWSGIRNEDLTGSTAGDVDENGMILLPCP